METTKPQEKIIVFRAYDTAVEANIAKTKLDAYGIPCFLTDENFVNLYPIRNDIFPGVRLYIFENDLAEATEILSSEEWKKVSNFLRQRQKSWKPLIKQPTVVRGLWTFINSSIS